MKKRWYDFLWIASGLYLLLGFFNILFAWLGLLCFFIPLLLAAAGGGKASDCIKCGRCEAMCPQHLPIRTLLQEVAKVFEQ